MTKLIAAAVLAVLTSAPAFAGDVHMKSNITTAKNIVISAPGALTLPTCSLKRKFIKVGLSPNNGSSSASTTYRGFVFMPHAYTLKGVSFCCITAPIGAASTIKVLKGSSAGTTMLSTATVDATALVANTVSAGTLSATSADLSCTATQPIYVEFAQGATSTQAAGLEAVLELEPTDY